MAEEDRIMLNKILDLYVELNQTKSNILLRLGEVNSKIETVLWNLDYIENKDLLKEIKKERKII